MDFRMAPRLIRLDFVESISKPQTGRICFACGINKSRWLPKGLHPGQSKLGMGHCHFFQSLRPQEGKPTAKKQALEPEVEEEGLSGKGPTHLI